MTDSARQIISALALIAERLAELTNEVKQSPAVVSVKTGVTPRRLFEGDRIECFADAELASGTAVGWWMEFWFSDGSWNIDSSVRYNTAEGEDELIGLPTRFAVQDDELIAELDGASKALLATTKQIELAKL